MVIDGAVLNVSCVVPMSAYEVGFTVADGVLDVSVVVPTTADVIIDGSASIKATFRQAMCIFIIINYID